MCIGMFMAILDIQVVASSLPAIQAALRIPTDELSWIQTSYLIAEVMGIPLTVRLMGPLTLSGIFVFAISGFLFGSAACAMSDGLASLIVFRVLQGFCGGMIIPTVFTAVFALFPTDARILPTTVAGVFAMLAPTLGPAVGGYITETYSWHWLFLVNLAPGAAVAAAVGYFIRIGRPNLRLLRRIDLIGLAFASVFLAALELSLKEGPKRAWHGTFMVALLVACVAGALAAGVRCLRTSDPLVELRNFGSRPFAAGCVFSFVLGAGLYGSVYLLPLFLGLVRHHTPFEIGEIMIVCGAVQLATSPLAAVAERQFDPRLVTVVGYALFAAGLFANGFTTYATDFHGLFWPQVLRGAGVMLCLLPTTSVALEGYAGDALANASALFNLMRNLGGAVGIALIDTVIELRPRAHAEALFAQLQAGSGDAARLVGLPLDRFHGVPLGPIDDMTKAYVTPLVERAALVLSFNEAWLLLGTIFAVSLPLALLVRKREPTVRSEACDDRPTQN